MSTRIFLNSCGPFSQPMKRTYIHCALVLALALSSCSYNAFYLSPFNSNTASYKPKPLLSDSVKSASYGGIGVTLMSANADSRDFNYNFQATFHRSHTFQFIQAYYGATAAIGAYHVDSIRKNNSYYVDENFINANSGIKKYSGIGVNGGVNIVVPMNDRAEWRIIGVEGSYGKEFGDYLNFRKMTPDSAANAVYRPDDYGNLGLTSEIAWRKRNGFFMAVKGAYGWSLHKVREYPYDGYNHSPYLSQRYFTSTIALGRNRVTGYMQFSAGSYTTGFQGGIIYRL